MLATTSTVAEPLLKMLQRLAEYGAQCQQTVLPSIQ